jgi:hypothetical protein
MILHSVNQFNTFTNTSNGRDKFSKILQNSARVFNYYLSLYKNDNDRIMQFVHTVLKKTSTFESNISMARKVFRFGKFTSGYISLYTLLKKIIPVYEHFKKHGKVDLSISKVSLVELLTTLQRFIMANFFFMDMFNWAAKLGLLFSDPMPKQRLWYKPKSYSIRYLLNNSRTTDYSDYGNYIWFIGVCLLLSTDALNFMDSYQKETALLQDIYHQLNAHTVNSFKNTTAEVISEEEQERSKALNLKLLKVYSDRDKLFISCARNICDMGIAASLVHLYDISKGTNGVLGLMSALLGSYEAWPASK